MAKMLFALMVGKKIAGANDIGKDIDDKEHLNKNDVDDDVVVKMSVVDLG